MTTEKENPAVHLKPTEMGNDLKRVVHTKYPANVFSKDE